MNGRSSSKPSSKRSETEEERRIRKEKIKRRSDREKTSSSRVPETVPTEKPSKSRSESKKSETKEERQKRKEREKRTRDEVEKIKVKPEIKKSSDRKTSKRDETPEERKIRKEKEAKKKKEAKSEPKIVSQSESKTPSFMQNTKSRELKAGEKIVKPETAYDDDFEDFQEIEDEYDEDFEDYEEDFDEFDDFEEIEFNKNQEKIEKSPPSSNSTSPEENFEKLQNKIKSENNRISSAKEKPVEAKFPSKILAENHKKPQKVEKTASIFSLGATRRRNNNDWVRARAIQKLITFDITHDIILHINQESDYTRYMKRIANNHKACVSVGTEDNQMSEETQTELVEVDVTWTQNQQSAKSNRQIQNNLENETYKASPIQIQKAAKVAEILLSEIDDEKFEKTIKNIPSVQINISEKILTFETDWNKIAIATDSGVAIYSLSNTSIPILTIPIRAEKLVLRQSSLLIGGPFGSISCYNFENGKMFSTDCYTNGHRAKIKAISTNQEKEVVTADIFGGLKKWDIKTIDEKFELIHTTDLDKEIYDVTQDKSRIFVSTFDSIAIINSTNFEVTIGHIWIDFCKIGIDQSLNMVVAATEMLISIFDLSTNNEKYIFPNQSKSICLNDGKLFAACENDVLCIDLESGKKQTVKIPGCEEIFCGRNAGCLLMLSRTNSVLSIFNLNSISGISL